MYPRSTAPRDRPTSTGGPYPLPGVPRYYDYNEESIVRRYVPRPRRLPPYEWKLPPSPPPNHPSHTPPMTNGRKRHHDESRPYTIKRQRIGSHSPQQIGSPMSHHPLSHLPNQVVAGSSRSILSGFNPSYPTSHHNFPSPSNSSHSFQVYGKDKLSDQMVELFEACQQQPPDLEKKEMFRTQLQQDIQRVYAVARLYLTGSSMNGLGCRSSDADLCLVLKENKRHDPLQVLHTLQRLFRSLSYVERTQLIRAKVPILRFREKGSDLQFDLNVNNTVGIRNTFLLRSYAYADPRIRPMILVIKKWARYHHINDASKGTLSSYTLVLMVLHYLQSQSSHTQRDYPECFNPLMDIDVVPERAKHVPPYNSRNHLSLGDLFCGFLRYYTRDFRWDRHVISVREARALPQTISREWRNKYICVEEPFERNNVARAVHEKIKFDAIRAQFAESCQLLHETKDLNVILPVRAMIHSESSTR
ncbi:poly(A) RNA polymerase GLD2 isoform X2 [Betta splendens]|uniref:polynucleotide adenylyltransferase n=1 Tax=Betta splendens TaxID=158456 RepID=A0A6P7NF22_BETSP|nr:poly(A) RNA polymerase GLD2 isoform X2 [Betta splendens]